jgi:hypothetical protein
MIEECLKGYGASRLTTIRRTFVSPISAFLWEALRAKGNHASSFTGGLRPAQAEVARFACATQREQKLYHSLNSPACACVSITLPASL